MLPSGDYELVKTEPGLEQRADHAGLVYLRLRCTFPQGALI